MNIEEKLKKKNHKAFLENGVFGVNKNVYNKQ